MTSHNDTYDVPNYIIMTSHNDTYDVPNYIIMTSHNDTYDVTKWVIMTSCQHDLIYLLVVFLEGLEKLSQCLVTGSLAELLIALEQVCGGKGRKEWGGRGGSHRWTNAHSHRGS